MSSCTVRAKPLRHVKLAALRVSAALAVDKGVGMEARTAKTLLRLRSRLPDPEGNARNALLLIFMFFLLTYINIILMFFLIS